MGGRNDIRENTVDSMVGLAVGDVVNGGMPGKPDTALVRV